LEWLIPEDWFKSTWFFLFGWQLRYTKDQATVFEKQRNTALVLSGLYDVA